MVYTSFALQLIDIKRIETRSNLAFDGKVLSSFERISRLSKNIRRYNWYVFTTNKYKAMVYIKDTCEIGIIYVSQYCLNNWYRFVNVMR